MVGPNTTSSDLGITARRLNVINVGRQILDDINNGHRVFAFERLEGELISAFRITMESMVEASDLTRPLDREKILAIPMCKILKKELDRGEQCSICLDKFMLAELVKKLPCKHLYHEDCITPWLELRDSCPVCRGTAVSKKKKTRRTPNSVAPTGNTERGDSFCLHCNRPSHGTGNCPFEPVCYNCGRNGHIARNCSGGASNQRLQSSRSEHDLTPHQSTSRRSNFPEHAVDAFIRSVQTLNSPRSNFATENEDYRRRYQQSSNSFRRRPTQFTPSTERRSCFHCGQPGHIRPNCPHRIVVCYVCGGRGHISRHCSHLE